MDESLSDPLEHQRVELENLQAELNRLQHQTNALVTLARRVDVPPGLRTMVAQITALEGHVRAAREQAAAAITTLEVIARAAEARRQRAHHLRTLYTVGQTINSTLELADVLNLVIDNVVAVTQAERGYIVLRDEMTGDLTVAVARGIDHAAIDEEHFAISRHLIAEVATTGKPVLTTNAQADPRFSALESVRNYSLRAIMCAPLLVRGQVGGVVYVDHRLRAGLFTSRDLDLLMSIADQAALAIDRARVFGYLSSVLASIASGVVTVDPHGTIVTFNRSASAIFGLPAEQAIGRGYAEVFGLPAEQAIGRGYAEVFGLLAGSRLPELILHVHETGEPVLGYEARADVPGRGEVVLLANIAPVTGEAGERLGVVMVLEDRTHERRMQRFIAPSVVEHVLAAHASPRLGGELRTITVLFGDVQGYTTLSERLAPEELLDLLNAHLSLAASTIMDARYRGTLDKYIGDAVMGLFNTPETQPEHAWQAVCASWAMQTRLHAFQESLPPEQHLRFRVGVNTGEAVVGHVGTEDLMNFTAVGDAVNVAKRLQESARPGQVVISAATLQALTNEQRARLQVREVGPLALKGRVAEVVAYEVLGIDEATDATDRID